THGVLLHGGEHAFAAARRHTTLDRTEGRGQEPCLWSGAAMGSLRSDETAEAYGRDPRSTLQRSVRKHQDRRRWQADDGHTRATATNGFQRIGGREPQGRDNRERGGVPQ